MDKKVFGVVCGCALGLLCFLFLNWIGWGLEINRVLLFILTFSPSLVAGIVYGREADQLDLSVGSLLWDTLKTALRTIGLGIVANALVGIYIMFAYTDPAEWLVLSLFLGVMFGAAAPVLIIIFGD